MVGGDGEKRENIVHDDMTGGNKWREDFMRAPVLL